MTFWKLYPATRYWGVIMVSRWLSVCLSICHPSICSFFFFPEDKLSKCQWIFTKLGVCIDIVKIVIWQISSIFDRVICPRYVCFHFWRITLVNINGFSPKLMRALILWRSGLDCCWTNFINFWQCYLPPTRPYFQFLTMTFVNINGFSPNLVCALILWRSALGLLMY